MTSQRDPSLVVVQLSGGNDAMNTVVPYTDGIYHDSRSANHLTENDLIDHQRHVGLAPRHGYRRVKDVRSKA